MNLEGSVVLVTGASRGIGRALVDALVQAGAARVYAAMRTPTPLDVRNVVTVPLDITDPASIRAAAERCSDVSVLVNNAGVLLGQPLLGAADPSAAEREMRVNYLGPLEMCRHFAPVLARNGGGALVNVLSILSRVSMPSVGSYCASKAALYSLTQAVRAQLAGQGTLVVGIMPAFVDTDMARRVSVPKLTPAAVAEQVVDALRSGTEDVYPGLAGELEAQLRGDPKAVERQFAAMYRAQTA